MAVAWQVFLGLALFAVALCLVVILRRAQMAVWARARPVFGQAVLVFCVALVACALAGGVGYAIAWAMS